MRLLENQFLSLINIFFLNVYVYFLMSMSVFPEYMCVHHMNTQCPRSPRRILHALKLNLQRIVRCHVDAGNCTRVLPKNKGIKLLIHLSNP